MSRAAKIVLALVAVLLLLGAAAGAVFWKRPLATLAWLGRRRLSAAGFEKRFQPSAVGPQCVFSGGGGGAPVVLVHGAGDQAGGWAKVAPRLAKSFAVLAVDLAGHGESAPAAGPLPFATLLAGFDGAMKEVPQGKVTLVGNSLGAWVATVWAKEHPERVQHLVLVNGGPLLGDRPDLTLQPKNRAEADRTLAALRDPSAPMVPDFVVDDIIRVAATGPIAPPRGRAEEPERVPPRREALAASTSPWTSSGARRTSSSPSTTRNASPRSSRPRASRRSTGAATPRRSNARTGSPRL